MPKLKVPQIAKLVGKTPKTIHNHRSSNRLTMEKDEDGEFSADASEVLRAYSNVPDIEEKLKFMMGEGTASNENVQKDQKLKIPKPSNTQNVELAVAYERISSLETLNAQLEKDKEYLQNTLTKAQNNHTLAIEDKRSEADKAEDWRVIVKEYKDKISAFELKEEQIKQADTSKDRENSTLKQKLEKAQKELEAEKSKSVWQKLVGK